MVFFWILAGLTWLGGVVSMLTDLLNLSVSYQFDVSFASVSKDDFIFWVKKPIRNHEFSKEQIRKCEYLN